MNSQNQGTLADFRYIGNSLGGVGVVSLGSHQDFEDILKCLHEVTLHSSQTRDWKTFFVFKENRHEIEIKRLNDGVDCFKTEKLNLLTHHSSFSRKSHATNRAIEIARGFIGDTIDDPEMITRIRRMRIDDRGPIMAMNDIRNFGYREIVDTSVSTVNSISTHAATSFLMSLVDFSNYSLKVCPDEAVIRQFIG